MTELIIISIYLALLLLLGLFASRMFRGTSQDYMLASHSIGPFLLLMSLFGTTMTAFALVGSTGEAYQEGIGVYGMLASSSGIIHSLCFFVVGVRLWKLGRRYGYTTQIEFFRDRLQSDRIGLLLFPVLVGLVIPYLLIGVMSSGVVINSVTAGAFQNAFAEYDYGLPPWLGSLVICGVVLVYVFWGGMRGTAWANAFQTIIFMLLGLLTFWIIQEKLGGVQAASQAVLERHPSKMMRSVTEGELQRHEASLASWRNLAWFNFAEQEKGLTVDAQEAEAAYQAPKSPGWQRRALAAHAAQRGLVDLTAEERQRALLRQDDRVVPAGAPIFDERGEPLPLDAFERNDAWEGAALAIFADRIGHPGDPQNWTRKKALGVYRATRWAPEAPRSIKPWIFLTYLFVPLSIGMFPHLFQHWLTARSAASFKLAVVAHPVFIMIVWVPCVLVGVWATTATVDNVPVIPPHFNPNAVLSKMVADLTTPWLGGLLTAGILAAIMSSLDSQFLCLGTMFTTDIVVHYGGGNRFTDRQKVMLARGFIVAIVALTYSFSLLEPRRVFTLGVWCFSGFASLFPICFAAIYWRRLSKAGAYAGVLGAIGAWCWFFCQSGFGKNPHYEVLGMLPVASMFAIATGAMVLVSLVTQPPDEAVLDRFFAKQALPRG